ncbi:MAG: hypothetical protein R3F39_22455 [Myxococcota bacterium]
MEAQPTPDLPKLYEGRIDAGTLAQLFADVEQCTDLLEVRLKGAAKTNATETATLSQARQLLETAAIRGVQLTYRYEDVVWQDTLLTEAVGNVRLVRVARTDLGG